MPNLASADWLIVLIYGFFVLSAGFSLLPAMTESKDYLQAGRKLPAWLAGVAMLASGMGSQELIGMGAAGAHYGLAAVGWFTLGAVPAMIFTGLYLVPVFYGSKNSSGSARSIPEYLGLRFDSKMRALNACLFVAMALFSAGISLYAMARIFSALHIFDTAFSVFNLPHAGILVLFVTLPALLVMAYVLLGGLTAAIYNQVLQFFIVLAGMLPVVFLSLKKIGGWSGLKAAVPPDLLHEWAAVGTAGSHSMGAGAIVLVVGVGLVLGGGMWCADFRLLQAPMAAKNLASARKAPLIAAAFRVFVPLVLVLPGLVAIALPTPHTTITIHDENGAIYHEITVVPPAVEAGQGVVPARADPVTEKPQMGADGHPVLDYAMATPNMLLEFLPTGLLGLGLSALIACLMSGVAASLTACNTVFACDIYHAFLHKAATDKQILKTGRWAAVGGTLIAVATACAAIRFSSLLDAMLLVFALVNAPLFATLLLAAFWKRATGSGAIAGQLAGAVAALVHHSLALPMGEQPGIHGGWIRVLHHPASELALNLGTAIFAFTVSLLVTTAVSLFTKARPEAELAGMVHSLLPTDKGKTASLKRPEVFAVLMLLAAITVNLIFL